MATEKTVPPGQGPALAADAAAHIETLKAELALSRKAIVEWEWFFENAPVLLCVIGTDGRISKLNRAIEPVLGYAREEFMSLDLAAVVHPDDLCRVQQQMADNLNGGTSIDFEMRMRCKDKAEYRWFSWTSPGPMPGTGDIVAIVRDVTDIKLAKAALLHQAQHDTLTGLSNRAVFNTRLAAAIARAGRNHGYAVVLLLIDLDGFKLVNDTHGHHCGDQVLQQVSERLISHCRRDDVVCRLGGDEFALIVEGFAPLSASCLARKIVAALCQPMQLAELTVTIGCSIGISEFPRCADNPETLVQQADEAMYRVKRQGKNAFAWHVHPTQAEGLDDS
ncbi:GGDEF domain-containing protein [Oxalobacteraceae bacterium]|nr:GGDEF domain-containing protein [Oxalobacteraceae bacterium]